MSKIRNKRHYIDISPDWALQPGIFPGDTAYRRKTLMKFPENHLELSSFESTFHIGAHTDAPCHYSADGSGLEARDLNVYMGRTQVIEVELEKGQPITPAHINSEILEQRVLFKTNSFDYKSGWTPNFSYFSPETIEYLAKNEAILVGIDTPSVDSSDSKDMPAHKMIFKHDLAILEGINLSEVHVGIFDLVALPLPISEVDATPVRAILMEVIDV